MVPALAWGQYYFGQNKVQYTDFDWKVLTTEHFNIYFYPEEEHLARVGANIAEESYTYLVEKFNHVIDKKIPLIVYSSPTFFQETNVIPQLLPEGVAGFTEYMKERVVVQYHGSYKDFAHLIRHELVHVFQLEKILYVAKAHRKRNPPSAPLWFTEGIAEYWSQDWDPEADMIIKDMVISGDVISYDRIHSISGTFMMYKVGQSFLKFVSEDYGDDRLTLLYDNWWKEPSFEQIFYQTFGKSVGDLWREWEYHSKKTYFPYLEDQHLPSYVAKRLTKKRYNVKPAVFSNFTESGQQNLIAFKTLRLGYTNIAVMPLGGEELGVKRIIKGQRSAKFESLHFIESKIDVNNTGHLAFASKSHESDVLYVYDTRTDKVVGQYRFEGLVNISSPSWSADGKKIVFSGAAMDGSTDIYIYELDSATLSHVTDDFYYDVTPAFSRDGNFVVFSSDRGEQAGMNIFAVNPTTGEMKPLTHDEHTNLSPRWSLESERLLFTSDGDGASNVYLLEDPLGEEPKLVQLTDFVTGAFDPVFGPGDSTFIFCGYQEQSFHIYSMELKQVSSETPPAQADSVAGFTAWEPPVLDGEYIKGNVKYKSKFSFDLAQSVIAYDAVFGSVGGLQGALTDMLGNHQYYFLLYNTADTREGLLNSTNAAVTYLNRKKRLNWGFGLYRFFSEYNDDFYGFVSEETYGGLAIASYPFSRYDRVEGSFYLRKYYKQTLRSEDPDAVVGTGVLSYIKDTSIWEPTGPIDGYRLHLTLAGTVNLRQASYYNSTINIDLRKYLRLSESSAFAVRTMYFASDGTDPQRYYLGGSWDLRGYPRRYFYGSNLLLLNNELRFPLVDRLYVGFPIGAINLQAIRGAIFFDAGKAWDDQVGDLVGSFGFGIRVALGYITVLRFDFARKTDFNTVENGFDFDFFFGWNF